VARLKAELKAVEDERETTLDMLMAREEEVEALRAAAGNIGGGGGGGDSDAAAAAAALAAAEARAQELEDNLDDALHEAANLRENKTAAEQQLQQVRTPPLPMRSESLYISSNPQNHCCVISLRGIHSNSVLSNAGAGSEAPGSWHAAQQSALQRSIGPGGCGRSV